jgi:DNA polymerase III delta prime subunit
MKFYETHYEEYLNSVEKYNYHPDKINLYNKFPFNISLLPNIIFYGPTGVGKYSQVLRFLKKYSPSQLKYEKKMEIETEKLKYNYRISDIHYEIDMSLLGCNSKLLWHEVFSQIIDIISNNMKTEKIGFVVCKNFHNIHNELLDVFYSYIQQYRNTTTSQILIRFIIITEHISFIPNNIIHSCQIISFSRPSKTKYWESIEANETSNASSEKMIQSIDTANIVNSKEIKSFYLMNELNDLPVDVFNIVCNQIIQEMINPHKIVYMEFRDKIYDILIYNLDAIECIWYIFSTIISLPCCRVSKEDISDIIDKIYVFLKYYNNNYRPIYHLESILFTIITKLNG